MQNPSQIHLRVGKRILRYLQGTKEYDIWYKSIRKDDMNSTSGYVFYLGLGIFSRASKKQAIVAQSTAKVEYVVVVEAASQAIYGFERHSKIREKKNGPTTINCNNKSTITMKKIQCITIEQNI